MKEIALPTRRRRASGLPSLRSGSAPFDRHQRTGAGGHAQRPAADFHQTESGVGLAVTAYGWVGALAALLSGAMPARISARRCWSG